MITYNRSAFGWNLIFRVHGSAVYRATVPSLISLGIFFLIRNVYHGHHTNGTTFGEESIGHPYAIGVLVASITFLIVFRANQGYNRYWEAAGAVHHMMSKWMDATIHSGVYHLQCDHYKDIKPPSYFDYPELNHLYLTRDRERGSHYNNYNNSKGDFDDDLLDDDDNDDDSENLEHAQQHPNPNQNQNQSQSQSVPLTQTKRQIKSDRHHQLKRELSQNKIRAVVKSINYVEDSKKRIRVGTQHQQQLEKEHKTKLKQQQQRRSRSADDVDELHGMSNFFEERSSGDGGVIEGDGKPMPLLGRPRLDGNWGALYGKDNTTATFTHSDNGTTNVNATAASAGNLPNIYNNDDKAGFASIQGGRTPPLFLQELAHLSSLLVAVSLSTLRNDIDGSESPLAVYEPGNPWPEVDPDKDEWLRLTGVSVFLRKIKAFLGNGRSREEQTRYNAGRPLPVIGGVSDAEIRFLQMAKGPYAKTQLCWNWLSEFCIREHLAGSMGNVGPPIVSRVIQFLGDGMIYYNHARKIMFIPFPFVHAQLSVIFILVMVPCIPFLMDQFTEEAWIGSLLTFFTVLCLSGIHEVARELENPFRNVPNELPLLTFQAQYNEALITMYSGYHPDHFWDGDRILRKRRQQQQKRRGGGDNKDKDNKDNEMDMDTDMDQNTSKEESATASSKQQQSPQSQKWCQPQNGVIPTTMGTITTAPLSGMEQHGNNNNNSNSQEINMLKQQLAEQAKLIEQLAAKVNFQPEEEAQKLAEIADDSSAVLDGSIMSLKALHQSTTSTEATSYLNEASMTSNL